MSAQSEGPSLKAVSERFLDAERRLTGLLESIKTLQETSEQLAEARGSVRQITDALHPQVESLRALTGRVAEATLAIEATNPAELMRRLESLDRTLANLLGALNSLRDKEVETREEVSKVSTVISVLGQELSQGLGQLARRGDEVQAGLLDLQKDLASLVGSVAVAGAGISSLETQQNRVLALIKLFGSATVILLLIVAGLCGWLVFR